MPIASVLTHFYWGFLLILLDFRLQGVTILPAFIGYILFAIALGRLVERSEHFRAAQKFNLPLIFLSIPSVYQPQQHTQPVDMPLGIFGILLFIAVTLLSLVVVYHIFMGLKELSESQGLEALGEEAELRWKQFLGIKLAGLFVFVLMPVPVVMFFFVIGVLILTIVLTVVIMQFISKCQNALV